MGFALVGRGLAFCQSELLSRHRPVGRARGGWEALCSPRRSVSGLAASGHSPASIFGCARNNLRADSGALARPRNGEELHAMAGSFEFNSFGYALLAAMFGSSAARSLWLILFGVVATSLFVRWAKQEQSLRQAPVTDVLLAFFLLTPVLNPWYLVWLVPFVALAPTRRAVALLVVVPLSYATGLNLGDPTLATYGQPNWVRPIRIRILFARRSQRRLVNATSGPRNLFTALRRALAAAPLWPTTAIW